ncbi:MAG: hypothetical protein C4K58_01690 [Flavobacteriaceae bacterium]|nr:MAG: hypothetical protein C4K58_01690 [Flavobacteriaceae bacterium]
MFSFGFSKSKVFFNFSLFSSSKSFFASLVLVKFFQLNLQPIFFSIPTKKQETNQIEVETIFLHRFFFYPKPHCAYHWYV